MRTVLTLPTQKKAVVDIPYNKFPTSVIKPQQEHVCCESKVVVSGGKRANVDLKQMVQEMEQAYDRDVKELTNRAAQAEQEKAALAAQHAREISGITDEFRKRETFLEKQVESLKTELNDKQVLLRKEREEKELILRSKISEFRQQEYISRISEQDQIIRLRQLQLKELLAKLEVAQIQRQKAEQQALSQRIRFQSEISRLSLQLSEATKRFTAEQSNISFSSKLREQASRVKEEEYLRLNNEIKYQLQAAQRALKQNQVSFDAKNKQFLSLLDSEKALQRKVAQLQQQLSSQKSENVLIQREREQLLQRVCRSSEAVAYLDEEKGRLLLQLSQKMTEIGKLKADLTTKQRVYEIKVERVIDGKAQIEQLQAAVWELQQQLKLLSQEKDYLGEDLKKKQAVVDDLQSVRLKLEAEINGLKAYISKREGSFRWSVERQIEKDIAVSGHPGQLYKVSQLGEHSREVQQPIDKTISQQIAMNMQAGLFGAYPQEILLQQPQ